ncbi:uncharacterized protein LOC110726393 [Chenopodium quinoa]|uniref:uncharacterized protein LOC110726393 n=1 Tax=Chenopodium quinoa TaxID=63459 RepID=UPI000B7898DB|nr:uncharacterized protein LOC110726393 [Chenopodium quinoa]
MSVLSVDGTHLYGKYKGTLLVATSVDANFQDGLCVISDRHAGIIVAMSDANVGFHEPRAFHRFCVRHMASNLRTHVKNNKMRDRFKAAAYQRQGKKIDEDMRSIGQSCLQSLQYIMDVSFPRWSLFHGAGRRYGICTTNFLETFNNVFKGARFLPIMSLVELTFHRVNKYFNIRRDSSFSRRADGYAYSPKVTSILEKNNGKAEYHTVDVYSRQRGIYQVKTHRGERIGSKGGHKHTVNFNLRTCTCKKPMIFHLPCSHVLAMCLKYSISKEPWVDSFLRSEAYANTYVPQFWHIPCETTWRTYRGPKIIPDESMVRGHGRPKSKRI